MSTLVFLGCRCRHLQLASQISGSADIIPSVIREKAYDRSLLRIRTIRIVKLGPTPYLPLFRLPLLNFHRRCITGCTYIYALLISRSGCQYHHTILILHVYLDVLERNYASYWYFTKLSSDVEEINVLCISIIISLVLNNTYIAAF